MIAVQPIYRRMSAAIAAVILIVSPMARAERVTMDLSDYEWHVARDFSAPYESDELFLPPADVKKLPVNPPTWGWDFLAGHTERTVHVPATIEELFWGDNGNTVGVAGDYRGVSWWTTTVLLGDEMAGKRVFLDFDSVHLRAEVFVNRRLTGCDIIGHTPFSVDITDAVRQGENEIAVRITDPLGNFSWNDRQVLRWGRNDIPACHGFGGITGPVTLRAVDPVSVDDIFVMNRPKPSEADFRITIANRSGVETDATVTVRLTESGASAPAWEKRVKRTFAPGATTFDIRAAVKRAKLWTPDTPALYEAVVTVESGSAWRDTNTQTFGFRWFDVGEKNGDRRFYLNGRRIVLLGGMSWGFWPVNGVFPTRAMAERDVTAAKELGLNYMNFHRAIGQPLVIDVGDERGIMMYEEPGGYSCEGADSTQTLWREWRRIKFLRMVRRDRSHPSLIIYNLQNRTPNPLTGDDLAMLEEARELDPSRIYTFTSGFWKLPSKESPDKLHFLPYDETPRYTGWFDTHNHTPTFGYVDDFYNGSEDYLRYHDDPGEIQFWGEDGGLYAPPRLALIKEYHERSGKRTGWLVEDFLRLHDVYDEFLDGSGFRRWFPDVDAFTTAMGNVTLSYHGRIVENVRAGNSGDAYTINGWAAPHIVNQSEVADMYRNTSGDPGLLARYGKPLYLAVKLRDRVGPLGTTVAADVYIVNETGVRGKHELSVEVTTASGTVLARHSVTVSVAGGEEYGQLLAENIAVPLGTGPGYVTVTAVLTGRGGETVADGSDNAFAVDTGFGDISRNGAVIDDSGVINATLQNNAGFVLSPFESSMPAVDYIVVAEPVKNRRTVADLMERAADGATVVVLTGAQEFMQNLNTGDLQAVDFRGEYRFGKGSFVAGRHEILDGLPQAVAFDWEYQAFLRDRTALRLDPRGIETVVAAVSGNHRDVGIALCMIPFGRGRVVASTLGIPGRLADNASQNATAVRLFANICRYASVPSLKR